MDMKYFFSKTGDYLGGFNEAALSQVPEGAIEIKEPPNHGLDKLIDGIIIPYVAPINPLEIITTTFNSLPSDKQTEVLEKAKELFNLEGFV